MNGTEINVKELQNRAGKFFIPEYSAIHEFILYLRKYPMEYVRGNRPAYHVPNKLYQLLSAIILYSFISSCSGKELDELFLPGDGEIPRIIASFPIDGSTGVTADSGFWILFDRSMDQQKTQSAFRLSGAGGKIYGRFQWESTKMIFSPDTPIDDPDQYTMTIDGTAESSDGVNIEKNYTVRFYSISDLSHPYFLSSIPSHNQSDVSSDTAITLRFSKAIDISTISQGITFNPSFIHTISQNTSLNEITFTPSSHLSAGQYLIRMNQSLRDLNGNGLLPDAVVSFTVGTDFFSPSVVLVRSGLIDLEEGIYIPGAEKNAPLLIRFSEAMDRTSAENSISFSPPAYYNRIWIADDTLQLDFLPSLASETYYMMSVDTVAKDIAQNSLNKSYSFGFITDGIHSTVPEVQYVMQSQSSMPGFQNSCSGNTSFGFTATSPLSDFSSLDLTQFIDMDPSSGENCVLEIILRFNNSMRRNSFLPPNISFSQLIDPTNSSFNIQDILLSDSGCDVIIRMSANITAHNPEETPVYRLTVKGGPDGIYDANNNYMPDNFSILFTF